jgi:hypothetical protein
MYNSYLLGYVTDGKFDANIWLTHHLFCTEKHV